MSGTNEKQPPPNFQNDYALDLLETEEDFRRLIALRNPQEAARLGKITFLPTSFSDGQQRERRPDKVVKVEVLDKNGKVIGFRIYLFEFKSEIRITSLFLQILTYLAILWVKYRLPVVPIIVYTGKRRLQQNGRIDFRKHMQSKNPAVSEHSLDFSIFLLNVFGLSVALLQEIAGAIAPGLYLAPRVYNLTEETVLTFFRMCAELPEAEREQQLEKGCTLIVKCDPKFGWASLEKTEKENFPEKEWYVARLKFSREAYGDEREELGIVKGKAEGLAEGKAEGLAEGEARGKGEERRDIAMRMLKEDEPEAKIIRITGLSKKELQLLKRGARKLQRD